MKSNSLNQTSFNFKILIPYIFILLFNELIVLVYPGNIAQTIPFDIIIICFVNCFLISRMKNVFNKIISGTWLIFYFLGVLNINSSKSRTNIWNLEIHDASFLYLLCLLVFILGILFFERKKIKKKRFVNDQHVFLKTPFIYLMLIYPLVFIYSIYTNIGILPILSGQDFVGDMYEFNYGFFYGLKFLCVYSFSLTYLMFRDKRIFSFFYLLVILFIVSVDGKRFILLMCILSFVPLMVNLKNNEFEVISRDIKIDYSPIILSFSSVGIVYILINILRTGSDIRESLTLLVENIPFGVEFKDYVHCFNTYNIQSIRNYNFEWSAFGSFANSTILEMLDLDKNELYKMGSHHAFMNLYNEKFGIRIGIVGELYFAYGFLVLPIMILIAFFANNISQKLMNPNSYFNLIQNSILFALFILLINGQATVFFGCLTVMVYTYLFYRFCKLLISNNMHIK
ncbi:hypothetical protein [Flavobacterium sp. KACC 22763]|uniref:hypothetical protein n=1 Tax=Flavobacterium sp. KACC 22763 TaxID=3025668 RepID=UPI0023654362|nr:hypothetical protein [Flavobacterium sp. KACC 22763]WDF62504.1 hypothetical protein PQ463_12800 [Flavobacterium sp. KACC 22763]